MKLGAFLIAATMAGRADKRGKSGRRDMSNERYIWQSPRCMVNEALCDPTCNLEINQEPFKNLKSRFFHISKFQKIYLLVKFQNFKNQVFYKIA